MYINPIQALHYVNPKVLNEIVGFKVLTFYTSDSFTVFWESIGEDKMVGRVKELKTHKVVAKCLEAIEQIQKEVK